MSESAVVHPFILGADPQDPMEATTKQYVDGPRKGVIDGTDAAPGDVGEYLVTANTTGIALISATPAAVCQVTLPPGVWEIWGSADFGSASNVSPNMICAAVSQYPDALPTDDDLYTGVGIMTMFWTSALTSGQRQVLMTGQCRANLVSPLDLYLVAQSAWNGGGTMNTKGYISARRVR